MSLRSGHAERKTALLFVELLKAIEQGYAMATYSGLPMSLLKLSLEAVKDRFFGGQRPPLNLRNPKRNPLYKEIFLVVDNYGIDKAKVVRQWLS
jgi:hypothetical protein